ncbi:MAG: hypothetical protein ABI615_01510 [Chthoniobacterales bacterium]
MKNFLLILFLSTAVCASAYSQDATAAASATPTATPAEAASPSPSVAPAPAVTAASPAAAVEESAADNRSPGASPSPAEETAPAPDQSDPLPSEPDASTTAPAAQGPTPAAKKTDEAMSDAAFTEPNSFVPEDTQTPGISDLPQVKQNEAEKVRTDRLRYRKAKTQADKDSAVHDMREQADAAKNDGDRRAAFRKYYDLLNKKIVQIDASVADFAKIMKTAQLARLNEDHVEPTIPLSPPPTPNPARQ